MRNFAKQLPLPLLGIASIVILPVFACYLGLCVLGAAVATLLKKEL